MSTSVVPCDHHGCRFLGVVHKIAKCNKHAETLIILWYTLHRALFEPAVPGSVRLLGIIAEHIINGFISCLVSLSNATLNSSTVLLVDILESGCLYSTKLAIEKVTAFGDAHFLRP